MPRDTLGNAARRLSNDSDGPWKAWKGTSRHGRAIKFIETYCKAPKGEGHGSPLKLHPFQKHYLEEAFATGVEASVMPTPRGNGKSTFAAAIAVWAVFDDDVTGSPQVPIVATTVGQAIRSVYGVAEKMVRANDDLVGRSLVYTGTGTSRIVVPSTGGGELFPIASDPDGLQGLDPSVAVCDELGFQPQETWDSLILAAGKRSRSLVMGMGTPGLDRENALWHVRELVQGGVAPRSFRFREFAADPDCRIDDHRQWRKANPAIRSGFLRIEALETALALVPASHFRVFRLGQWVDGVESWLGDDGRAVLEKLRADYQLVEKAPTWVGVDCALSQDTTSVTLVQYRTDRPDVLHAVTFHWVPTAGNPVDLDEVEDFIRQASLKYRIGGVSYDPRFFESHARKLHDEGVAMMETPQHTSHMTGVIGGLYQRIHMDLVSYTPDKLFEQQVLNAVTKPNEIGFTLSKGKSRGHIDSAISWALAVDKAVSKKTRAALVVL